MIWKSILVGLVAALVAFAIYVRLAPVRAEEAHGVALPQGAAGSVTGPGSDTVIRDASDPMGALAALDAIVLQTPRTTSIAGGVYGGRITYMTRSRLWGFPDFTTIEARPDAKQLVIHGRLRFGRADMGVNRARIEGWLQTLDAPSAEDTPNP